MMTRIRFLGVAGYEIRSTPGTVLIDPFLDGYPSAPITHDELDPDLILVTHGPFDHLGDTAAIARRTGCDVLCGPDVRLKLIDDEVASEQVRAIVPGIRVSIAGFEVAPVYSAHASQVTLRRGDTVSGPPMGFVIQVEPGLSIYHTGDTCLTRDIEMIARFHRPTVGLIGCAQPTDLLPQLPGPGEILSGEMTPEEAALAVEWLNLECAIASHYSDPRDPLVVEFVGRVKAANQKRHVLAPVPGQWIVLDPPSYSLEAQ